MATLALVLIITLALIPVRGALFEMTFATLLLCPIVAFPIFFIQGPISGVYYFSLFVLIAGFYLVLPLRTKSEYGNIFEEVLPIFAFSAFFIVAHTLCLMWPDFLSMGERIRDYALLSSIIHWPVDPIEPWMSGAGLNYYVYWYRFGHLLHSVLDLKTWEIYHQLQSFTMALYFACTFRIFRKHLAFSRIGAVFCGLMIAFGSNVAGVQFIAEADPSKTWWEPSRVIKGAIDEFPAWSFLLGDLHPHYLNLPLAPILVLIFLFVFEFWKSSFKRGLALIGFSFLSVAWFYNSNALELPVWLAVLTSGALLVLATNKERLWPPGLAHPRISDLFKISALIVTLFYLASSL